MEREFSNQIKAKHYLTLAAKNNHPIACRFLAEGYYYGKMGLEISPYLARYYAKKGEKYNDPGCLHLLGLFHSNGDCFFEKSEEKAGHYFKEAVDLQYALAYRNYIQLLLSQGGERNEEEAIHYLSEIAKISGWGAFQMGWCYEKGIGVEQSNSEAFRYYGISSEADYPEGKLAFARCYREGIGTARSETKAKEIEIELLPICEELKKPDISSEYRQKEVIKVFQRAQRGSAKDQCLLGKYYLTGKDVKYDLDQAIHCFKLARKGGSTEAAFELGKFYEESSGLQSPEKAVHFYSLAAHQNHFKAQICLSLCYARGFGVDKSLEKAQEWVDAAKLKTHLLLLVREDEDQFGIEVPWRWIVNVPLMILLMSYGLDLDKDEENQSLFRTVFKHFDKWRHKLRAEDHFELALLYEYGLGVDRSLEQAFQEYQLAANQYPSIHFDLYRCYIQGIGVDRSYAKAIEHLKKAFFTKTRWGNKLQQYIELHAFDFGLNPSQKKIREYFQKLMYPVIQAAQRGGAESQFLLGCFYEKEDRYAKQDDKAAFEYYKLAADQNYEEAIVKLGNYLLKENAMIPMLQSELIDYFRKYAEKGNDMARYFLILKLNKSKKHEEVFSNLRKIVQSENLVLEGKAEMECLLAHAYAYGEGTEVSPYESLKYYILATDHGCRKAPLELGVAYLNGRCGQVSYNLAKKYLNISLKYDNFDAYYYLGVLYGKQDDFKRAIYYLNKACQYDSNDALAFYNAGICFQMSQKIYNWKQKAADCFKKAADLGHHTSQYEVGLDFL